MRAYRMTVLFVDLGDHEPDGAAFALEATAEVEDCIVSVLAVESADVGEWTDGHPLNDTHTDREEVARLDWQPVPMVRARL